MLKRKHEEIGRELEIDGDGFAPDPDTALDDHVGDDLLRLVFISCHPVLSPKRGVALTLPAAGGLTTDEIARAFLVPEPTIAQRIVRAQALAFGRRRAVRGAARRRDGRTPGFVLEVVYLVSTKAIAATAGDDWMRPQFCEEAMRLGRSSSDWPRASRRFTGLSR